MIESAVWRVLVCAGCVLSIVGCGGGGDYEVDFTSPGLNVSASSSGTVSSGSKVSVSVQSSYAVTSSVTTIEAQCTGSVAIVFSSSTGSFENSCSNSILQIPVSGAGTLDITPEQGAFVSIVAF